MLSGCWDACVASELHNLILVASSDYEHKPCLILLKPSCLFLSNTTTTETIHIKCRISFIYLGRGESTKYSYSHRKKRKKSLWKFHLHFLALLPSSLAPRFFLVCMAKWGLELETLCFLFHFLVRFLDFLYSEYLSRCLSQYYLWNFQLSFPFSVHISQSHCGKIGNERWMFAQRS